MTTELQFSRAADCPAPAGSGESGCSAAAVRTYLARLDAALKQLDAAAVVRLARCLQEAWQQERQVFLCGNGGSAANAMHLANDLLYGAGRRCGRGMRVTALPANPSVLTCLANDLDYADIYAEQLRSLASPGDVLVVLSGSGNSPNVVNALQTGARLGMVTAALLGFDGGACLTACDIPVHVPMHDMQIVEDIQVIIGHMLMRMLLEAGRD